MIFKRILKTVYILRGNRDFRACEAFRAAATAKENVKATRGSMTESDFLYFKSQRKAMFEEWGIVGSKSRRARDMDGRFSRFGEVGANGKKNEEPGLTIDELDEE